MSAYVKDDGGREAAGFRGPARDCAARAYAIASGRPYAEVYEELNAIGQTERRAVKKSGARTGVHAATMRRFMEGKGWRWTPTMGIGTGCNEELARKASAIDAKAEASAHTEKATEAGHE